MDIKPDWNKITQKVGEDKTHEELQKYWLSQCNEWLLAVARKYGDDYRIEETPNFSVLSNESPRYVKVFSAFLERTLKRILRALDGVASDEGYGKHVAMIFANVDQYYDYLSLFYPEEGQFGLSSGSYINQGYGHFAFPSQDIDFAEPLAVHELTHACLAHLPIPIWLNEGLAVFMEENLAGQRLYINNEIVNRHQNYWNQETIQDFWSGDSFYAVDQGQELSYHLAHILVSNITSDYSMFSQFANSAHFEDAGASAAGKHLGISLEYMVGTFLGIGDWEVDLQRLKNHVYQS